MGLIGSVDVLLTTNGEMRRLNRSFRGKDRPTDVLSFTASAELREQCAGDLAISLDMAARQARQFGHSLSVEVRVLMLHGLLHLAGFDHEVDGGEMAAEELRLRVELRLPVSLIARATAPAWVQLPGVSVAAKTGGKTRRSGVRDARPGRVKAGA